MQYTVLIETTDQGDLASLPGEVASALTRAAEAIPGIATALVTQFSLND